ncbi:MAG: signal peptidase I [Patescibacteria group bacterium]|nr:signal peptidase I [Patescibacteria group bacterium]
MSDEQKTKETPPAAGPSSKTAAIERGTVVPKISKRKWWYRPLRVLRGLVIYVVIVAVLIWGMPIALSKALHTNTPMAAITSGSMWPVLKVGDLIFVQGVKPDELKVGDIVVYENERGYTIHRIIEIDPAKGMLTTQGDANNVSDKPIKITDVVGRALTWGSGKPVRIPRLGFISIGVAKKLSH